ncbi:MAG: transporter substrate-binding domain-containing protein [Bacteroidota bacterium]
MKSYRLTRSFLILIGAFICSNAFSQYKGDSWADVQAKGSGKLSIVYYEISGMIEQKSDGQLSGVCVDILNDFVAFVEKQYGKKLTLDFVAKEKVFSDFLSKSRKSSNVLAVSTISITDERKEQMKFTPAFMPNPLVFLTHKNAPTISNLNSVSSQLKGYRAMAIKGGNNQGYLEYVKEKYYPELQVKLKPSEKVILKEMQSNTQSFTILDFTDYYDVIKKKLPLKRQKVNLSHFKEEFGFVMSDDSDWGEVWNAFLTPSYKNSMSYKKAIMTNLGSTFASLVN